MHILLIAVLVVLFAGLMYFPSYWVTRVLKKYHSPDDLFPGTGGELAVHLLKQLNIEDVKVEQTDPGQDHYDPTDRTVRLSPDNFSGRSLTAITIAAHEVGHAIQHASGYHFFRLRHSLVKISHVTEKLGSVIILAMPVVTLMSRSPTIGGLAFLLGISGIAFGTLVHFVTLPVEWNASFGRALPLLRSDNYISEAQSRHSHRILKAAALTYVSGSLASLLNLYRWIAILKR